MAYRRTSLGTALPPILFITFSLTFLTLPSTISAQSATPCATPNPCTCTASLLLSTLSSIPGTLLPPVPWTPVTNIIPVISGLLDRSPPAPNRQRSFLREIESATDAMFASQFAAHTVANNARVSWQRVQPLLQQIRASKCDDIPVLRQAPTADVFAKRFPPTPTVVSTLISYDALRTIIRPYKRALMKIESLYSDFSRNEDVKMAVGSAVRLLEDIVASDFDKTITAEKFTEIDALDLNSVFNKLVYGWYRARKISERRVFLAIADQVEPLKSPSICGSGPVNNVTCAICT